MAHGYFISGIRPYQYERIMTATEIIIHDTYLNTFFESYSERVKALAKESTQDTLLEHVSTFSWSNCPLVKLFYYIYFDLQKKEKEYYF